MKTEMQREYEQLCRIDENPGVQGLAQLGRNAINRVSRLESQLARADARIAELEREIERLDAQWRDELRIYRETEDVRIAELESRLSKLLHAAENVRRWDWSDNDEDCVDDILKLGDAIDAARANGGEG